MRATTIMKGVAFHSLSAQARITVRATQLVRHLDEVRAQLSKKHEALDELEKSLLRKAFTGHL